MKSKSGFYNVNRKIEDGIEITETFLNGDKICIQANPVMPTKQRKELQKAIDWYMKQLAKNKPLN